MDLDTRLRLRQDACGILLLLAGLTLLPGCLALPFVRTGPAEAKIEGAASNERFVVKGRVPYLIVPRIERSSAERLASGAIVRAEARDHVQAVTITNDTGMELWLRTFEQDGQPISAVACEDGEPSKLQLPRAIPAGHDLVLLAHEGEKRRIDMILKTLVDRDDLTVRFGNGPALAAGFVIIPLSLYTYHHLPVRCRDAVQE